MYLFDLFWPFRSYYYEEETENGNKKVKFDSRIDWFKNLSYDKMTKVIDDLQELLDKFKEIRKTNLQKEIEATESKLKRLKEI